MGPPLNGVDVINKSKDIVVIGVAIAQRNIYRDCCVFFFYCYYFIVQWVVFSV